jgi:anti-sigma-K factor RskA
LSIILAGWRAPALIVSIAIAIAIAVAIAISIAARIAPTPPTVATYHTQ